MIRMPVDRSLRRLLSVWLVAPLLALIVLSSIPAYLLAVKAANDAYDDELLDPAIAIARFVRLNEDRLEVDLPPVALEALRVDTANRIFFRVTGPDGALIAGNATLLKEMVRNLIDNAINYTPSSPEHPGVVTARVSGNPKAGQL